jgi:DUF4097 and DUF4098 domain-containing protein YvlB
MLAATALTACSTGPLTERRNSYDVSGNITRLVLTGTEGKVRVHTGDGPVTVAEKISFTRQEPTTKHRVEGSTLYVDVDGCGKTARRDRCDVSFDIRLPGSTAVEVTLVAGAVDVRDLSGDLKVETTAGAIEASGLRSQNVDVRTEAGEVTLTHQVAPAQTSARTRAGTVTVRLPGSDSYAVDATTDAGRKVVSVSVDPASAHRVTALTDAGDVTVAAG